MSSNNMIHNISGALSIFAERMEAILQQAGIDSQPGDKNLRLFNELMDFFPIDKVDRNAGTYDQYLFDLRKTVTDNYMCGNYQVAYFYAHLIFMSYAYYSIELAYSIYPDVVKDQYELLNAYGTRNKPNIQNHGSTYDFSKIPEKEIFKVFYSIGLDVQFIQQLSTYVEKRDDYAHATGEGNINIESFEANISAIKHNMDRIYSLFIPHLREQYKSFLLESFDLSYEEVENKIGDYILDHSFSKKDIEYLCNIGISNFRNESLVFLENYRHIRKVHCAFIEHCLENFEINNPEAHILLRDEDYLQYYYKGKAREYVEIELGINEYRCAKDGGEFPVYECPECGEDQLVYNAGKETYHCFSCDDNFSAEDLSFCKQCGNIMLRTGDGTDICPACIEDMSAE